MFVLEFVKDLTCRHFVSFFILTLSGANGLLSTRSAKSVPRQKACVRRTYSARKSSKRCWNSFPSGTGRRSCWREHGSATVRNDRADLEGCEHADARSQCYAFLCPQPFRRYEDRMLPRRPVPLHLPVLAALLELKEQSLYKTDADFLFPLSGSMGKTLGSR